MPEVFISRVGKGKFALPHGVNEKQLSALSIEGAICSKMAASVARHVSLCSRNAVAFRFSGLCRLRNTHIAQRIGRSDLRVWFSSLYPVLVVLICHSPRPERRKSMGTNGPGRKCKKKADIDPSYSDKS